MTEPVDLERLIADVDEVLENAPASGGLRREGPMTSGHSCGHTFAPTPQKLLEGFTVNRKDEI